MADARRVNRAKYARAQEYIRTGAWIVDPEAGLIRSRQTGKPLRGHINRDGYRMYGVTIPGTADARWRVVPVKASRVIFETVHGFIADGLEVNHIDGDKANDSISNLEAVTAAENIQHAVRTGLLVAVTGERSGSSRLTEQQVREIRELAAQGTLSQAKIAAQYGVRQGTVSMLVRRLTWSHVA